MKQIHIADKQAREKHHLKSRSGDSNKVPQGSEQAETKKEL